MRSENCVPEGYDKHMSSEIERPEAPLPRKRASSAARQATANLLAEALADGQITIAEFDERTAQVWQAVYADELDRLTADVEVANSTEPVPRPAATPHAHSRAEVVPQQGGSAFSLAIMGGSSREGSWRIARHHTSLATMGGHYLDLREATLSAQETVITAIAVMGGIEIVVPEDVRVLSEGFGIMGGFGVTDHPSCTLRIDDIPASAPIIRIRGLGLMGGVGITRAARGARV